MKLVQKFKRFCIRILIYLLVIYFFFIVLNLVNFFDFTFCLDNLENNSFSRIKLYSKKNLVLDYHYYYNYNYITYNYLNFYKLDFINLYYFLGQTYNYTYYWYDFYFYKYLNFLEDNNNLEYNLKFLYLKKNTNFFFNSYIYIISNGEFEHFTKFYDQINIINKKEPYFVYLYSFDSWNDYIKKLYFNKDYSDFVYGYKSIVYGSLFNFENDKINFFLNFTYVFNFVLIFLINIVYFINLYLFFILVVLFLLFFLLFNFYLSYKFYFIARFMKLYLFDEQQYDTSDEYTFKLFGYFYFLKDDTDITFNDDYYNIIKYEYNYLNYLVLTKKYLFSWILYYNYKDLNFFFFGLGQIKRSNFDYFSIIYARVETAFLPFLQYMDGDFYAQGVDWIYFPYEHIIIAFPESDYYMKDYTFNYRYGLDPAYDINIRENFIKRMDLHPYNLHFYSDYPDEYDEVYGNVRNFLKYFKNDSIILDTFKIRFKKLFKNYRNKSFLIENGLSYSKNNDSFSEMISLNTNLSFELFNTSYDEMDYSPFDMFRVEYDRPHEEYLETLQQWRLSRMEKFFFVFIEEEERAFATETLKTYFSQSFLNYTLFDLNDPISSNLKQYIIKNYYNEYSNYTKYENSIGYYDSSNYLFSFLLGPLLSLFLKYDDLYLRLFIERETDDDLDLDLVFEEDYLVHYLHILGLYEEFGNKVLSFFREYISFYDYFFYDFRYLTYSNDFLFSSIKNKIGYYVPPNNSFIGYLLLDPFLRKNRDLYLFLKLYFKNKIFFAYIDWLRSYSLLKDIKFSKNLNINSFEFDIYRTRYLSLNNYPQGMSYNSSFMDENVFSNIGINKVSTIEFIEEEDVNKYIIFFLYKDRIYSSLLTVTFISFPLIVTILNVVTTLCFKFLI